MIVLTNFLACLIRIFDFISFPFCHNFKQRFKLHKNEQNDLINFLILPHQNKIKILTFKKSGLKSTTFVKSGSADFDFPNASKTVARLKYVK